MRRTLVAVAVAATLAAPFALSMPGRASAGEPFVAEVSRLDAATRGLMIGSSWHEGCPVPLRALRLVRLSTWGFDDRTHRGRLVVHRAWADEIVQVFRTLYARRFPIRRMRLVDRYEADDHASMRHDNTSAFNCRFVAGTSTWSQHAYGTAIDINPVENPYVSGTHVSPRRGRRYLDRSNVRPGMVVDHGLVWRAFHRIGWGWGGTWVPAQDYQHVSASGT